MKEVSEEEILQVEDAWQQPVLQLQWIKKLASLAQINNYVENFQI
jgi:hypothetical protein